MVDILKKILLLVFALCFAVASHLRPVCNFSVGSQFVASDCTPAAARRAKEAALAAAEEILPGKAELPEAKRYIRFGFGARCDSAPALCDALLKNTEGVMAGEAVICEGERLGCVGSGYELCTALNLYIENTLPTWANSGHLNSRFELVPMYTRAAYEVSCDDMVMLLTGLAPVMYTDGMGRVSPV